MIPKYKSIIIGNTLQALITAYVNEEPVIFVNNRIPNDFEFISYEYNLYDFGYYELPKNMKFFHPLGWESSKFYQSLMVILSLNGLILSNNAVKRISIVGNVLYCIMDNGNSFEYEFEKLKIFDGDEVDGISKIEFNEDVVFSVYDYGEKTRQDKLKFLTHYTLNPLVNALHYINNTEFCSLSLLKKEDLSKFEHSDTNVKFTVSKILAEIENKKFNNNKKPIKTSIKKRTLNPNKLEWIFDSTEGVEFKYDTIEDVLKKNKPANNRLSEYRDRLTCLNLKGKLRHSSRIDLEAESYQLRKENRIIPYPGLTVYS